MDDVSPADALGRFLTLADTAEVLNITPPEALALIKSGELRAIKVGEKGQWRVERAELEGYIEGLYEQTRRMSLWNEAADANVAEFTLDRPRRT